MATTNGITKQAAWLSDLLAGYRKVLPNPLLRYALTGAVGFGAAKLLQNPLNSTIRSLGRPLAKRFTNLSNQEIEDAFDEFERDEGIQKYIPWVLGGGAALAHMLGSYNGRYGMDQLWSDNPSARIMADYSNPFAVGQKGNSYIQVKEGSLHKQSNDISFEYDGYVPDIDFSKAINANEAKDLFSNDPFLQSPEYSYARQFGTSVVTNAAQQTPGNKVTLGGIFDSAVQKFDSKLSLGGVASVGVKSMVANGMSRLLTSAIGSMVDLDPNTRNNIIDAGTWAGTVAAILE